MSEVSDRGKKLPYSRRKFIKRCLIGGCGLALGGSLGARLIGNTASGRRQVGFRNDAPAILPTYAREAQWYRRISPTSLGGDVQVECELCPHHCQLGERDRGFCRTRLVKDGKLWTVAFGNPCALHIDPVEKKPLYHFYPTAPILSLATGGCNLRCLNCQNWEISQSRPEEVATLDMPPEQVVSLAQKKAVKLLAFTYSDPIVFYEYTYESAALGKESGLASVLVTAGYIQPQPLQKLCQVCAAATVDVKAFTDSFYRRVSGATLEPVLRSLTVMRAAGLWLEVSNLVVPTMSDNLTDIARLSKWVVDELGADTPFHFLRFHPDYQLTRLPVTPISTLEDARKAALDAGLNYVYIGNVPGHPAQNTYCPSCRAAVIERDGFWVRSHLTSQGLCPCGTSIAGVWF